MKQIKKFIYEKPVLSSFIAAAGVGAGCMFVILIFGVIKSLQEPVHVYGSSIYLVSQILQGIWTGMIMGIFILYPLLLTLINLTVLFVMPKDMVWRQKLKRFEYLTLSAGICYHFCAGFGLYIMGIMTRADWHEIVYNNQKHRPVWSGAELTVVALCAVGIAGYLVLSRCKLENMSPLVIVLSMSAMYLGISQCVMWCIQVFETLDNMVSYFLCVIPLNCILIALKVIRYKIAEWQFLKEQGKIQISDKPFLSVLDRRLQNAVCWPVAALILALPLLGIVLCLLMLFGQRPDDIIKAWTQTADWRLSEQVGPPNAEASEHYLCTVAAGGHAKIVKPVRMGERNGHRVVVSRQLCIANAFEQIIEEKTPGFHRFIRRIYDTYGFPLSRLIRTKLAADIVYILMKPLEWIFLTVIYLCDVKPENRIAVQYLPSKPSVF